jgi:hypothetical protein
LGPSQQIAATVAEKLRAKVGCDVLATLNRTQHVITNEDGKS